MWVVALAKLGGAIALSYVETKATSAAVHQKPVPPTPLLRLAEPKAGEAAGAGKSTFEAPLWRVAQRAASKLRR
jgi:hypothetical protein